MDSLEVSDFTEPDETRRPDPHVSIELVKMAGGEVGRYTFEPGWRWSEHVKPVVGGESCQIMHLGYVVSGRMGIRTDDGTISEVRQGSVYRIPPGHDGWVIGDEPAILVEFQGAATYGKG